MSVSKPQGIVIPNGLIYFNKRSFPMSFRNLSILAISLAAVMFWTNCGKSNAVLNPNDQTTLKPLFSFQGYTSQGYPSNTFLAKLNRTLWDDLTDPLVFLQESKNPTTVIVWGVFGEYADTQSSPIQILSMKNEWPLRFRAELFDLPTRKSITVPGHPESWFSIGVFVMGNDGDNNGRLYIGGSKSLYAWRDSVEQFCDSMDQALWPEDFSWSFKHFPLSALDTAKQDTLNNWKWLRAVGKDWIMAQVCRQFMVFCSDSVAAAYVRIWADTTHEFSKGRELSDGLGLVRWTGLKTGYNLMDATGIIRKSNLSGYQDVIDYCKLPSDYAFITGCDSVTRVDENISDIEFVIETSKYENNLVAFTRVCLPWGEPLV